MTIGSVRPPRSTDDSIPSGVIVENAGNIGSEATPARTRRRSFERRQRIVLSCAICGGRNYRKTKARLEGAAPLLLNKFCSICNAHTQHREAV